MNKVWNWGILDFHGCVDSSPTTARSSQVLNSRRQRLVTLDDVAWFYKGWGIGLSHWRLHQNHRKVGMTSSVGNGRYCYQKKKEKVCFADKTQIFTTLEHSKCLVNVNFLLVTHFNSVLYLSVKLAVCVCLKLGFYAIFNIWYTKALIPLFPSP